MEGRSGCGPPLRRPRRTRESSDRAASLPVFQPPDLATGKMATKPFSCASVGQPVSRAFSSADWPARVQRDDDFHTRASFSRRAATSARRVLVVLAVLPIDLDGLQQQRNGCCRGRGSRIGLAPRASAVTVAGASVAAGEVGRYRRATASTASKHGRCDGQHRQCLHGCLPFSYR